MKLHTTINQPYLAFPACFAGGDGTYSAIHYPISARIALPTDLYDLQLVSQREHHGARLKL